MSRSPLDYCRHILDETAFLIEQSGKLDEASFSIDPVSQRAFVRSLEIIGEASKQVDPELRARYPKIPWTKMARMRDKVIHHYFGVEYDLVWAVVQEEIPKLDAALRTLLSENDNVFDKSKTPEAALGYLLKVTLLHVRPGIWRQLLVPSGITLNQLHNIIQEAMGWLDCHLHSFKSADAEYGFPDPDFPDDFIDDSRVQIDSVFVEVGQKILYTYDFGDDWEHEILFKERRENPDQSAILLAGRRACPPEDCGGPWGYQDLLKILKKKKLTQEEQETLDWIGDDYDPDELEIDEINEILEERFWMDHKSPDW